MSEQEVTLAEIYSEVDKRIAAAIAALKTELDAKLAEIEKRLPPEKRPFRVLRDKA